MKRIAYAVAAFIALGAAGAYGALLYSTAQHDPAFLLSCVDADPPIAAWTCKQVLRHARLGPEEVSRLNARAGARYAAAMETPSEAEEMLALLLARGVDINARDEDSTKGWSALHISAMGGNIAEAKLLIKNGARTDLRDKDGMTPLDLARRMREKFPNEPRHGEMVQLLEGLGQK